MSLQPRHLQEVPEETVRVARAAFPKGNVYMQLRDALGELYSDEDFVAQYDGAPAGIRRLPLTWDDPAEVLVGQPATLRIPESAADTLLALHIGIYSYETGMRLLRSGGENEVTVHLF